VTETCKVFNHLNADLNSICYLLALLGAHYIFHVSGLRVNDVFYKHFKQFVVLNMNVKVCLKRVHELVLNQKIKYYLSS
jgi:hypothetical protein